MNYFFQPDILAGTYALNPEESSHCIRVLRKKETDLIYILDGKGGLFTGKITEADPRKTLFEVIEEKQSAARDYFIHIAIAPTKNIDRLEWFIEKSVEIGIDRITFLRCRNSERKILKLDRLHKKAVTALKQSGNLFLPEMRGMVPIENFINTEFQNVVKYIAHAESGNSSPLMQNIPAGESYLILIGPEGDFSPEELKNALKREFKPVSLGPSRLRTETAGLVACLILNLVNS
jgi:16S rRNA (uracil1498-N3)-methyltransferase